MARKTHTSNEVKARYINKTYNRYLISLKKEEDRDLIALIEANKEKGIQVTETVRDGLLLLLKNE